MIYVKDRTKYKTIKQFLIANFVVYQYEVYKFNATFFDEACRKSQCIPARRSFKDLLEIVQTYFPSTTKEKLAYILTTKIPYLYCFYCNRIGVIIFVVDKAQTKEFSHYGELTKKDSNNITLGQILALAQKYKDAKDSNRGKDRKRKLEPKCKRVH